MKLWMFNAFLIICMLGICLGSKFDLEDTSFLTKDKTKIEDIYSENDKFVNEIEKKTKKNEKNEKNDKNENIELFDEFMNFLDKNEEINVESNDDSENNITEFLQRNQNVDKNTKKEENLKQLEPAKKIEKISTPPAKKENKDPSTKEEKSSDHSAEIIKTDSNIKIILVRNPTMVEDKKELDKYITYGKCAHKTGALALVKKVTPNESNPKTIYAIPIFVTLNVHTLSFFSSTKSISLFNNIKLERILKITQRFTNTFCFDVVENEISKSALLKGPTTICASTLTEMKEWIDAIEEFKECQLTVNPMPTKVLADFHKINTLLMGTNEPEKKLQLKDLYYENQKAFTPSPKKVEDEIKIGNELKQIVEVIKLGNLAQNNVKREMVNKLKTAEKFALDVEKKQNLVQEIVKKRMEQVKERETKLITIEHKAKELQLLKAVEERIKKMKMQELKDYKQVIVDRIKETKSKANDEAKDMMRTLMTQNKITDYDDCVSAKLTGSKNKDHISKTCFQYFGEAGQAACEDKKQFCNKCCYHHVGIKFADELFKCKSKCTQLINGVDVDKDPSKKEASKNTHSHSSKKHHQTKNEAPNSPSDAGKTHSSKSTKSI